MSEFPAPPRVHVLHVPGVDSLRDEIVAKLSDQSDTCVHLDPSREGCMATWLKAVDCAWERDADLDWSVILSDDADPLRGWQQHLERACTYSPNPVLGLTHFGGYGTRALRRGVPYGVGPYLIWGGAIAYHRTVIAGLADWAPGVVAATGYKHDDCLTAGYLKKRGWETAMVARAIFGQPVKQSLLGHNTVIRSPETTIENTQGPAYSSKPRAIRVHRGISPSNELERLARL